MKPKRIQHRERPILFSGPMVRAVLAGHKTQTRRVLLMSNGRPPNGEFVRLSLDLGYPASRGSMWAGFGNPVDPVYARCPYGRPGGRLWVRETWRAGVEWDDTKPSEVDPLCGGSDIWYATDDGMIGGDAGGWGRLRSSIFMPRWASRLILELTDVQVERVQEITDADVIAEGIDVGKQPYALDDQISGDFDVDFQVAFRDSWDALNGKRGFGWDVNPWTWVLSFKKLELAKNERPDFAAEGR